MDGVLGSEGRSAEFYGFLAVAGRTSSFIGPTVYGIVAYRAALWFEARGLATLAADLSSLRQSRECYLQVCGKIIEELYP